MIVHIVDVSSPSREKQESAVTGVLGEMKASDKPRLTMWNKLDLLPEEEQVHTVHSMLAPIQGLFYLIVRGEVRTIQTDWMDGGGVGGYYCCGCFC